MTPLFPMTRFRRASNLDACRDLSYSLLTYSPTAQRWRPAVNQSPASRSVRRCASLVAAVVVAAVAVGAGSTASSAQASAAPQPTALHVTTTGKPHRVHGSDGREHIEFNLVITNSFTSEVTLTSLQVRGGGKGLLTLQGDALAESTHPIGAGPPTTSIPPASTVATLVDVVMPRSSGRSVPRQINNRLSYTIPPGAPSESIIGSSVVRMELRVDRHEPIVIAPPLRGDGWASLNGCCSDPTRPHRSTILS